jgi:eukaryotic-like serine/threonine-protein kinase
MEYVQGVPITKYCDEHRLTVDERLRLFVQVCRAVQHAHQKGIIHRDLKPSNVLVARHDGAPVPKVIDFGVAKATGQSLTERTLFTGVAQLIGTPLYMSPEQADLSTNDVDTRSDVYSLGVLLYELLTGTTPFDAHDFGKAALDEMRRIIREEEPPRPSTRLSSLTQTLSSVSAKRRAEPRRLNRTIKGELDWITMKALEKDRERRYPTANDFAADIERYLASEPVLASPPSARYRLNKFVRRHKGAVLAASVVVLTLIGGVVGTTWGMVEARRATTAAGEAKKRESERADGEKEAREVAQKRLFQIEKSVDLLANIVRDLNPNNEGEGGRSVYEQLLERAEMAADGLDAQAIGDPVTLARLRLRIGETLDGLGNSKKAAVLLEQAHDAFKRLKGAMDSETLAAAYAMANAWRGIGGRKVDDAVNVLMQLREDRSKVLGLHHADTFATANSLAAAISVSGRNPAALAIYESIREPMIRHLGNDHPVTLRALSNIATLYHHTGRHRDAIKIFEDVRKAENKSGGIQCLRFLQTGVRLAETLQTNGDLDAAIRLYEEVVDALRTRSPHHVSTFVAMNNMAEAYSSAGRLDKSIPLLEELLRRASAKAGRKDRHALNAMIQLGANYLEVERVDEATKLLEEAFGAPRDHDQRRSSGSTLAHAYAKAGRRREARILADKMAYECRRDFDKDPLSRAEWLHQLGQTMFAAKGYNEADLFLRESLAIRTARQPEHWTTFQTQALLAPCCFVWATTRRPGRCCSTDSKG